MTSAVIFFSLVCLALLAVVAMRNAATRRKDKAFVLERLDRLLRHEAQ